MEEKKLLPKRRFDEFKSEWIERNFELLADIVRGASPRPIEDPKWFDKNSNIGWLRISDVTSQNGRIEYLEQKISELGQQKTRVIKDSHLLLSIAATVGKPVINYVKTGVHDGFLIFLNPKFDIEYMYQWLEMFRPKWQQYGQPGSQVNLNSDIVRKHILFIPKIEEQQKIGDFFKVLDERIANQELKIAKVKALKSAYLTEMFPQEGETVPKRRFKEFSEKWKLKTLSSVCSDISDGDWIENEHINNSGKYRIIQTGNLGVGKFLNRESHAKYINQRSFDALKANEVFPGDILISRLAEPAGRSIIVPDVKKRMVTAVDVTIIRCNDSFDKYFIVTQLNSSDILDQINESVSGTSHKRISRKNLEKTLLNIPKDIKEQQKVGAFFKNLDDQIMAEEKKLEKLKKTKKAYLKEMFV